MNDFDFDAAAADLSTSLSATTKVINLIESTGRKVVLGPDQMVAVNENGEVSFFAGIVEHNGEVCLTIPRTKWFAKFSCWLAEADNGDDFGAYVERTGPQTDFRVYVTA
jgi:hypothetical protein